VLHLFKGITVPRAWPQKGDIVFEDVSLRHDKSRGPVISNLNLHIEAGQKVNNVSLHCSILLTVVFSTTDLLFLLNINSIQLNLFNFHHSYNLNS
jgi:hypothetical protein